jgi:EmrB/QacA subfamily drug resistance transporter
MSQFESRAIDRERRTALLVATVSSFLSPFMVSSTNVALPTIAKEFHMGAIMLSWVPMAYILAGAVFLLPFSKIADIYGRKKVFTCGIALFTVSSVLGGLSSTGEMLIVLRAFQGVGSAVTFGTGIALLTSVFPADQRGRVLGLALSAVYVGLSAGPFLGGVLTEQMGWRSIFLLMGPVGATIIAATLWSLKGEWAEAKGERFDVVGSAVYCLALMAFAYGLHLLPQRAGLVFLCIGVGGLVFFARWESEVKDPVLDVVLFLRNRVFVLSNAAIFINYGATYAIGFLISLYLQYIKHLGPQASGLIMVSQPVVQALLSPYAGRLSDRVEPQIVASCGMGLTVIGLAAFVLLKADTALWFVVAFLALHGLGFALFSSPNTNAVMGSVEKRHYGVASGIASTMRLMGNSFSVATVMFVFALYIGPDQIITTSQSAFLKSMKIIFAIFALLCFGGIFASLARGKMR